MIDKSTNKSMSINHDDETITFKYDKPYELKKNIDTLILLNNNIMEPIRPKLQKINNTILDNKYFNDDDEYNIIYKFYGKETWSLKPSELYDDIRPK